VRLAEGDRAAVSFILDGRRSRRWKAIRADRRADQRRRLRRNEFSGQPRAGFCMMGACQDCWIATESGERLRACSTFIRAGMQLRSGQEEPA
jgi:hypothetical protein